MHKLPNLMPYCTSCYLSSVAFQDLVKRLLCKEPERRPTALGALGHAWIKTAPPVKMLRNWTFDGLQKRGVHHKAPGALSDRRPAVVTVASPRPRKASPNKASAAAAAVAATPPPPAAASASAAAKMRSPLSPSDSDDLDWYFQAAGKRVQARNARQSRSHGGAAAGGSGRQMRRAIWEDDSSSSSSSDDDAGPSARNRPVSAPHAHVSAKTARSAPTPLPPHVETAAAAPSAQGRSSQPVKSGLRAAGWDQGPSPAPLPPAVGSCCAAGNASAGSSRPDSGSTGGSSERSVGGHASSSGVVGAHVLPPSCKCSGRLVKSSSRCTCPPNCRECKAANCQQHGAFFGVGKRSASSGGSAAGSSAPASQAGSAASGSRPSSSSSGAGSPREQPRRSAAAHQHYQHHNFQHK